MRTNGQSPTVADVYITRPMAVGILGLSIASFDRLVRDGRIVGRQVPGRHARYSLKSVQSVAQSDVTIEAAGECG